MASPPRQIDGYRVMEFIGSGGVADVYRGESLASGEAVALKFLKEPGQSPVGVRRFLREGWLLRRFKHPGLPRCHAVLETPRPCIVLELLKGETLAEYLRRNGPLEAQEVIRVATQVLDVLDVLHQNGIVHRDIKSPNIFFSRDGRVLLMDLGLAIDPGDVSRTTVGDILGTYAYMAPEQIAGAGVDPRSDIYSLGVTLYEALSGSRPFHAQGAHGYLQAHKIGKVVDLAELAGNTPRWFLNLIRQFMARDPTERPVSAGMALVLLRNQGDVCNVLGSPPLVGRNAVRGAVEAVLDIGGVVHVVGEVGSGLGRVARLVFELAAERGFETLPLRCGFRSPSLNLCESLEERLNALDDAPRPATISEPAHVIERLAAARDLLLLVEEAHGATPEERRFLARLMARLPALPVVTVSQSPGPGLEGREVLLRPLRRDDIAVLVAGTLRCAAPPDDLIAFLNRECGGLPAFIVLAMRDLHSRGVLRARGAGADGEPIWMLDPLAMNESASGLRPALRYILKGLTPSSRKTLDVLSLAGEPLPLGLVQRALDMDPSAQELAEPLRAGLVSLERRLGEEWLSIRRPVIADTALETLDLMARRGLHQRLADALEGWDEGDWRDRRLTIHRLLGAPTPPTPFYLLEFARGLVDSGEHGKALDILGYLEGSQDLDAETTALLGILRGWALLEQGRRDLALSSFGLARQLALEDSYEALVAEARVGLAAVYWEIGETRHCASHLAEVRVGLLGGESRGRRAWLLGACAWYRGDLVVAQRLFDEAKAAGGLAAVDAGLCEAALLMEISENDEAGRLLDEVILALELKVQPRRLAMALYFRCLLACRTGELRTAVQLAQALQDAGQRQNDALHLFLSGLAWAQIYLLAGDAQRAARQLRQGRGSGDQGVNAHFRLEYRIILGLVRYSLGDRQAALSAFDQGAELARSMGRDTAAAICEGMAAVLTAEAAPLTAALEVLSGVGNHRWRAMLLLAGAVIVGDALALAAAVDEARRAGDSYLLLRALHAMGGPMARAEAASLASGLSEQVSEQAGDLRDALTTLPELQWALAS